MPAFQVTSGRQVVTGRLAGNTQGVPQYGAVGTGGGTTQPTDTQLFQEASWSGYTRVLAQLQQITIVTQYDTLSVVFTLPNTSGTTQIVTNAGLFDSLTGGTLFAKVDFPAITLNPGDLITVQFDVQYT
jgi:hypothetical protein